MKDKKNAVCFMGMGLAVLVLAIVLIANVVSGSGRSSTLKDQRTEITNLSNQVESQRASVQAGSSSVVQQTTGIDLERKDKDDAVIREFAKLVTTWSTHDEYTAMRAEVMEKYALSESSRFATVFLPSYGSITDGAGVEHNLIDYNKISCSYRGMKSIVSGISGGQYSYFVIVTCAGGRDGATSTFDVVFCCSVDGIGNISNLEAYTLT